MNAEEKILTAAKDVFMRQGLSGARMQEIADRAEINKALLHYYFRSKEKLFTKVFEEALEKYFQAMDVFSNNQNSFINKLELYIDNLIDFYAEYPQMSLFILKEIENNPEIFKSKVSLAKKNKTIKMIQALDEEIGTKAVNKLDSAMFFINVHSLCSYPFLASPIFKHALKAHGKNWTSDFSISSLKSSVKKIVYNLLYE